MKKSDLEFNFGNCYKEEIDVVRDCIVIMEKIESVLEIKDLEFVKTYLHLRISDIRKEK